MALRSLELANELKENQKKLETLRNAAAGFETRKAELEQIVNAADTDEKREAAEADVAQFETDQAANGAEIDKVQAEIERIEAELAKEEQEQEVPATGRKDAKMENVITRDSKEYIAAFENYIRSNGKDLEVRTLLSENATDGQVIVPSFVADVVRTAWEEDEIISRIKKTYLKGNVRYGVELSATGAVVHHEGDDAPDEEEIELAIIELRPEFMKKWINISDVVTSMHGEEFLRYIYAEVTHKIAGAFAKLTIDRIVDAPTTATESALAVVEYEAALGLGTIRQAAARNKSKNNNSVVIMNKLTEADLEDLVAAANYNVDPYKGLPVIYSDALPAYDDAEADDCYMIVGSLADGVQGNFPNGDAPEIIIDPYTEAKKDLVTIVGKKLGDVQLANNLFFTRVVKPSF